MHRQGVIFGPSGVIVWPLEERNALVSHIVLSGGEHDLDMQLLTALSELYRVPNTLQDLDHLATAYNRELARHGNGQVREELYAALSSFLELIRIFYLGGGGKLLIGVQLANWYGRYAGVKRYAGKFEKSVSWNHVALCISCGWLTHARKILNDLQNQRDIEPQEFDEIEALKEILPFVPVFRSQNLDNLDEEISTFKYQLKLARANCKSKNVGRCFGILAGDKESIISATEDWIQLLIARALYEDVHITCEDLRKSIPLSIRIKPNPDPFDSSQEHSELFTIYRAIMEKHTNHMLELLYSLKLPWFLALLCDLLYRWQKVCNLQLSLSQASEHLFFEYAEFLAVNAPAGHSCKIIQPYFQEKNDLHRSIVKLIISREKNPFSRYELSRKFGFSDLERQSCRTIAKSAILNSKYDDALLWSLRTLDHDFVSSLIERCFISAVKANDFSCVLALDKVSRRYYHNSFKMENAEKESTEFRDPDIDFLQQIANYLGLRQMPELSNRKALEALLNVISYGKSIAPIYSLGWILENIFVHHLKSIRYSDLLHILETIGKLSKYDNEIAKKFRTAVNNNLTEFLFC